MYRKDAFDGHCGTHDGLQPFCRRCDWKAKRSPHRGYERFVAACKARGEEPWPRDEYLAFMSAARWECSYCGGTVYEWGSGYWIDRIDSAHGYALRRNCATCCWPCNRLKSNFTPSYAAEQIEAQVRRWGRGRVPWQTIIPGLKISGPDVSSLRVSVQASLDMPLDPPPGRGSR